MIRMYAYAGVALALLACVWGWTLKIRHDEAAKWRPKLEASQALAKGWEKAFRQSEGLRAKEAAAARLAVNETLAQCDARVKQARASAKIIREIVNEPVKLDANRCPVRAVIGADRLRDALQPR